jgi:hypothetical protein
VLGEEEEDQEKEEEGMRAGNEK